MNNGKNWRKLVEWDKDKKEYLYRGHYIMPLSFKEQYEMPLRLQSEHYWLEISMIDRKIENEEKISVKNNKTADEEINEIFEMLGW